MRLTADQEVTIDPCLRPCPKPQCDGIACLSLASLALIVSPPPTTRGWYGASHYVDQYVEVACSTCGHEFCAKCSAPAHPDDTCDAVDDADFVRWKRKRPVKRCPCCGYQTEKHGGCRHMHCAKCRAHWCWGCLRTNGNCRC